MQLELGTFNRALKKMPLFKNRWRPNLSFVLKANEMALLEAVKRLNNVFDIVNVKKVSVCQNSTVALQFCFMILRSISFESIQ